MRNRSSELVRLILIILLRPSLEKGETVPFILGPFGRIMCQKLCNSVESCTVPDFSEQQLTCALETGKERDEQTRCQENFKHTRVITSHARATITVFTSTRVPDNGKRLQDSKNNCVLPVRNIFTIDDKENATMQSIAKSISCPNILYISLKGKQSKTCSCAIRFLNLQNRSLLKDEVDCCQTSSNYKQMFTGLCVITMQEDCLYVLHVGFTVKLFGYKEPCQTGSNLLLEYEAEIDGMNGGSLACFVYKTPIFFCLRKGKVYAIKPMVKHEVVTPILKDGRLSYHPNIQDIAVDPSFKYVIIVSIFRVTLAKFHFPKGTLAVIQDIKTAVKTVTWIGDTVLGHRSSPDKPFYKCSKHQVFTGECNFVTVW